MTERLILLPGWSYTPQVLEPLRAALAPRLEVSLLALPERRRPEDWLDELEARIAPDTWLGGWSLGGMLATQLAARRGMACRGLFTLCSNLRFRASGDWPQGMQEERFDDFLAGFRQAPQATLKRFDLLASRGADDSRELARDLAACRAEIAPEVLEAGLELLGRLDGGAALQAFGGPQLHLFAGRDALLPETVAGALAQRLPAAEVRLLGQACHAMPLRDARALAAHLLDFVARVG